LEQLELPVRFYFNLVRGREILEDEEGLEVADLHLARTEALQALRELKRAEPAASANWTGWRLDVTDASGAVLGSINLDAILDDSG
jgi:hypothetical protein